MSKPHIDYEVFEVKEEEDYDVDEFEPGWYWRQRTSPGEYLIHDARGPFRSEDEATEDAEDGEDAKA